MSAIDDTLATLKQTRIRRQTALNGALQMQAIGHLASAVAHDLANLLSVVACNTSILQRRLRGNCAVEGELESLELASRAASGIVQSLLNCHRSSASRMERIRLNDFLQDSVRLLRVVLPKGINLDAQVESLSPLWVRADASRLRQVLLNLAVNARDAMPSGGTLHLSVALAAPGDLNGATAASSADRQFACLKVTDTGTGISEDQLSRVFEPLFTTKSRDGGTGLGLAIVRDVILAHGGRVDVRSTPGVGTTFTILLPISRSDPIPTMFDDSGPFIAG